MDNMKKTISIILASICIIGLVGCGANKNANTKITENQTVEQKKNNTNTSKSEEQKKENNDEKISMNPLIGEWSDVNKGTVIEFTQEGKLLRAGTEVDTYELIGENTVKLTSTEGEEVEITYEIDGDTLKWATNMGEGQEFKKMNPVG